MTTSDTPPPQDARQAVANALGRLATLHPKVIDLSLGRIETLLEKLGNPHRSLPPVLHVAGTNGKGSVVATSRAIAEAAGLRVHSYISPHLVRFNERIRLQGQLIDDTALSALLDEVEAANGTDPITFFEITTAAALLAFSRIPADLCILEVGLGGRLDATNVIDRPAATAITPISYDHQAYLGDDLADIAAEKAGIMKSGVPAILGPQFPPVDKVLRRIAHENNAPCFGFDQQWQAGLRTDEAGATHLIYKDAHGILDLPAPVLAGAHQAMNASTAIALLRHQNAVPISEAAIRAGLGWVRWPARLQKLDHGPLRELLPEKSDLWLDGGHNPAAARAVREALLTLVDTSRPVSLIVGMMGNRDPLDYLRPFQGLVHSVYGVTIPNVETPCPAADIAAAASSIGMQAMVASSVDGALKTIAQTAPSAKSPHALCPAPFVLIAGSLYLAGDVLAKNGPLPD
ncbi:bifunctional folylpolyglutamate synthase/dihydrofolate synthase [Iodidimonas gelatinilytica]|uniref:tetrahydrofolate synthase n=1 Tax=Iodidimonas gelatinilytica TaxID=1236966 RepID=A0A5A7N214_9PROT|nr:folylpolyglutamate synthase/dihydrofolate synthase family protein [Iodidimonas gelatinilytica]GEQ97003.1 bifunctional folylpolyglutamate synthase/dihydrofolate synthase [Iodidimonas gelatinilytica]GER01734.1 bifunctional folylpolyglutamate synthase/dihydrofolate synthase [Iodidimonas gelatinilytica]